MVGRVVVDNSVLVPLFFPDEQAEFSDVVLSKIQDGTRLIAPRLAVIEFGNTVLKGIRQSRISQETGDAAPGDFVELPIEFLDSFSESHLPRVMKLAQKQGLSAYDATYLALAMDEGAKLATLDAALRRAAESEEVGFIS